MCGIVGYIGGRDAKPLLIEGLKRMEYRGYDSCGVAVMDNGHPFVVRSVGRVSALEEKLRTVPLGPNAVRYGIGHTRWATHGRPSEENAHPHRDCTGQFMVVHNGIIENYLALRRTLTATGHVFRTATDTEVLPHLIEAHFDGDLEKAVRAALREVEGAYGMVAISGRDPNKIVAARKGPPLVVGLGAGEYYVASDAPALLPYTREMLFLDDSEMAVIDPEGVRVTDFEGRPVQRAAQQVTWSASVAEKEGYPHFMLKEIFEQPRAVLDTLRGRIGADDLVTLDDELGALPALAGAEKVHIVACGTSLHAGMVGKFLIEGLARIPVEVDYASEFRYRNPPLGPRSVVLAISQSGETADTLAALHEARAKGATLISVVNVVGSNIARDSDAVLYTHAGLEIGVASTKAFTTQLAAMYLLAVYFAQRRGSAPEPALRRIAQLLKAVPEQMKHVLDRHSELALLAGRFASNASALYLGRGLSFPIALEGALKLKEISYVHAEGYAAGEMKHGPIALIDAKMPVMVLAPQDPVYAKTMANIEEVKARDGIVVAVATEGDTEVGQKADHVFHVPRTDPILHPLLTVLPLQLLAYHAAVLRGCDVDKPRNLAKSVTVE
jgi:glucosamine--fructose-6-phosphate aminotransferase (isomerizing)